MQQTFTSSSLGGKQNKKNKNKWPHLWLDLLKRMDSVLGELPHIGNLSLLNFPLPTATLQDVAHNIQ